MGSTNRGFTTFDFLKPWILARPLHRLFHLTRCAKNVPKINLLSQNGFYFERKQIP